MVNEADPDASKYWYLGAYYPANYPRTIGFFEGRLVFASTPLEPERFDASVSGDWGDFAPTQRSDGAVADDSALSYQLGGANDVQVIRWVATLRNLILGTTGGIWLVQASSQNEAVTPTNINLPRSSAFGCAAVQPVTAFNSVIYVSRTGKKILAAGYSQGSEDYVTEDLTIMAEHVTGAGIDFLEYQQEPHSVVWALRSDGELAAMTYERGQKVHGWHRHVIGGSFGSGNAVVESVAVIPAPNEDHDQVWLIVKRTVNGATVRHIEFMEQDFSDTDDIDSAFYLDSGLSLNRTGASGVKDISGATVADPVVITATSHGFSDGNTVRITHVKGMTELNGKSFTVANKTTHTFELSGVDGSGYTAWAEDGEVRKEVTAISGLDHLEGETVQVLADGAVHPDVTVASGAITLASAASEVHIGYSYNADVQTVPFESQDRRGSTVGRTKRPTHAAVRLHRTLGILHGPDSSNLTRVPFRSAGDPMDAPPPLFTGLKELTLAHGHGTEPVLYLRQADPLPAMILSAAGTAGLAPR